MSILSKYKNNEVMFNLIINGKKLNKISIKRISKLSEQKDLIVNKTSLFKDEGYFKVNQKGFQTLLVPYELDLIFTDRKNKVIVILENVKPNTITQYYKEAYYLYILPAKSIAKNKIKLEDIITRERIK